MRHYFSSTTRILTLSVCLLAISLPPDVSAQQRGRQMDAPTARFTTGDSALRIPIDIDNNIILMRVQVNNSKPLKFIFDTGASHTVINSQRATELGLKAQGQARGAGTGGVIQGSTIRGVSLTVQGAEVSNQLIGSMAFPTIPGFEFDGIIGYDFINEFVVEIDYQNKFMNLYNPQTYRITRKLTATPAKARLFRFYSRDEGPRSCARRLFLKGALPSKPS